MGDPAFIVIQLLEKLGLAWDIHTDTIPVRAENYVRPSSKEAFKSLAGFVICAFAWKLAAVVFGTPSKPLPSSGGIGLRDGLLFRLLQSSWRHMKHRLRHSEK